ncbi:MAG: N-acetylmuramoyl-L-alanine amidase [Bacteroidales bacterium]|nr:N-acetylmuramoyl-L-alanine amidase [Bacteroidales bacterium]
MLIRVLYISFILFISSPIFAQEYTYLKSTVKAGEGAYSFLERYGLGRDIATLQLFREINDLADLNLLKNKEYKLPIRVYKYNGTSIRTTIGNDDYDYAVSIQKYNEQMQSAGNRNSDYRDDLILWVPEIMPNVTQIAGKEPANPNLKGIFPIFGKDYESVELIDDRLKDEVYYIVAGHGGPDPGAIGDYGGQPLCEDEYAYDIALRLARNLLQHDATVYMINRDPNDGIRNEAVLKADKDEVCYPDLEIPLNQVRRLNQRVKAINELYSKHKIEGAKKQRAIIIHVDSRAKGQRIDMFFYHNPKSSQGKKLAETLRNTIEKKYAYHQKGRGYSGTVKPRNLHMLRETYPVAVYAELGNIRNFKDQQRFVVEDNRQAVANWLCEGILND